jgi:two-component system, chemotaxis family, chemotaxis protein CheY
VRALVVDDSQTIRLILRKYLGKIGFEVVEATDGVEGITRLQEMSRADLVLVDWNMPNMSGVDFVRAVRAIRQYDSLPLVMVTTNTELDQVASALEAGANEYIMKPFTQDVIREKLELLGLLKT